MRSSTMAVIGLVLMGFGIYMINSRYQSTNTDRGVTFVIDKWTGSVRVCQMSVGCKPVDDVYTGVVRP